jgi:hypothetical protein
MSTATEVKKISRPVSSNSYAVLCCRPAGSWFLRVGPGSYPTYFEMVLGQFQG